MTDFIRAFKAAIEKVAPDFDHYIKSPRLGRVVRINIQGDMRTADLTILLNNRAIDESEPPLNKVPLIGGLVPAAGATVVVDYLRGDPDSPYVQGVVDLGPDNLSEINFKASSGRGLHFNTAGEMEAKVSKWRWTKS